MDLIYSAVSFSALESYVLYLFILHSPLAFIDLSYIHFEIFPYIGMIFFLKYDSLDNTLWDFLFKYIFAFTSFLGLLLWQAGSNSSFLLGLQAIFLAS